MSAAASATMAVAQMNTLSLGRIGVELQSQLKVRSLVSRKCDGVVAGVTRRAIRRASRANGREHSLETQIPDAVGSDVLLNLVERVRGGDQLRSPGRIDAVETRRNRRRTADAHVHFLG